MSHAPQQGKPAAPDKAGRVNSLGVGPRDLDFLLDEIDGTGNGGSRRRNFVRWPFRHASVPMKLIHPGGNSVTLNVACRNLSCGGMSVLHSSFIYPGSKVVLTLPHPRHGPTNVHGRVVRCEHRRGNVHDVGIVFESPIQAKDFVTHDPFSDWFSLERVQPESLKGTIVHLDDSPLELKLFQHFLKASGVKLVQEQTIEAAITAALNGCDLVVTDLDLGAGVTGTEFIQKLRAAGVWVPVILVTADASRGTRQRALESGANAFLSKPMAQETVLRALGEFMLVDGASDLLETTLPEDHPHRGLVSDFADQLPEFADRLTKAMGRDDATEARSICLAITNSAPMLGFDRLGQLAERAAQSLAATMSMPESIGALRTLITACEEASKRSRGR